MNRCSELHPESGEKCTRTAGHAGDHYVDLVCWPNANSPRVMVDLDTQELWTLWTMMKQYGPGHVRYGRINAKLTAALEEVGEEV